MEKKPTTLILLVIALMIWLNPLTHAAPPNGAPIIHLTVKPSSTIKITIIGPGTVFWIETAPDVFTEHTIGEIGLSVQNIFANNSYIKIHGEVRELICSQNGNKITGLNAADHKTLYSLSCNNNAIDTINLGNMPDLVTLYLSVNAFKTLDISGLNKLQGLYCNKNQLTSLDVTHNPNLVQLRCGENALSTLDVSKNPLLEVLYFASNNISTIDLTQNTQLMQLGGDSNKMSTIDLTQNTELTEVNLYLNQLASIDLSKNTKLLRLNIFNNLLTALDVSQNQDLRVLHCFNNAIDTLDLSSNAQIYELGCASNGLKSLVISPVNELMDVFISNNKLSTEAFNEIFCLLPDRTNMGNQGKIMVAGNSDDPQYNELLASDAGNAKAKNWNVVLANNTAVHTTGTYSCSTDLYHDNVELGATVYPNPAANSFFIVSDKPLISIEIYDFAGRKTEHLPHDQRVVNCQDWKPGIYFVRLLSTSTSKTLKVVKR
jgi:hypothetical protein